MLQAETSGSGEGGATGFSGPRGAKCLGSRRCHGPSKFPLYFTSTSDTERILIANLRQCHSDRNCQRACTQVPLASPVQSCTAVKFHVKSKSSRRQHCLPAVRMPLLQSKSGSRH
jgi:hypothetical protein